MGCKPTLNMSSSEDKIRFYGKFITKTRLNYMENAPLVKNELENNPVGWNTFIIDRLKKLDENHLWQSYTSDLIHFLEEKPLEQYMRPINSKSWLSLVETKKTEEKPYKTTYSMPKDSKFEQDNSFSKKLSHSDQNKDIKRLRDRLLAEFKAPNHIISELLSRFSELFLNKYLIFFSVDPKSNLEMLCESFKMDIRLLFGLMKDMIEKWYLSIIVQNPALAKNRHKRQEFLDSLINMTVFSNGNNIYYVLLSLYGLVYNISEKRLDRSMELLKGIKPENMEINPVFCLKKCKVPYGNVINSINEQSSIISATEKFQVICRIKEEIKDSIETYWEEWDPNIPAQKLMIDSDQLLTIVAFCIIKSQNCKLLSYLGFIRDFGNKNQMQNSYYFTTYDAALSYLLKLEESDIEAILKEDILKQND